jgi:hypothetical protein
MEWRGMQRGWESEIGGSRPWTEMVGGDFLSLPRPCMGCSAWVDRWMDGWMRAPAHVQTVIEQVQNFDSWLLGRMITGICHRCQVTSYKCWISQVLLGVTLWDRVPNETNKLKPTRWMILTLILRRSRTGTVWFYTSTSNKRTARPKLYTESLTRDLKRMYSRFTLVRISINL